MGWLVEVQPRTVSVTRADLRFDANSPISLINRARWGFAHNPIPRCWPGLCARRPRIQPPPSPDARHRAGRHRLKPVGVTAL
jgi:hypothetical protein